ncbi:MAG: hypothetical protein AAB951_00895, partial [Patescibacteria group bacterium]
QSNVEYFFRLIYECLHGGCYGSGSIEGLTSFLAHLWLWIIFIGYVFSVFALGVIIYAMVRLFELRKREEEYYRTLITPAEETRGASQRWLHIESLIDSASASDWRTAIIEADIMLDDLLTKQGYTGESIGEKLKSADSADFKTLQDAWEAHKVRNQIAHEGSSFDLSDTLAQRTIAHYEAVFRELGVI